MLANLIGPLLAGLLYSAIGKAYIFKAILLNAAFVLLMQPLITTGAPFIIRVVLDLSSIKWSVTGFYGSFWTCRRDNYRNDC